MAHRRGRRRFMAEINVVPYIDVMLVLLVIFMITAPLLQQGVDVQLPQAPADPLPADVKDPVIISVDADGRYFLSVGERPNDPVATDVLLARVAAVIQFRPGTPVMIKGDRAVAYGHVVHLMALLQQAGVQGVGLITEPAGGA